MTDSLLQFYHWLAAHPEILTGDGSLPADALPKDAAHEAQQLVAFLRFHRQAKARLSAKMAGFNRQLCTETEPHIHENLAEYARANQGGKYIRGALVNLGYTLIKNAPADYSDELALAFELFQTAILVHDDIIDHAILRRGLPTIPESYLSRWQQRGVVRNQAAQDQANAMAICAGDLGMYFANQKITEAYMDDPRLGRVLHYFNQVVIHTIRGEVIDVMLPYEEQNFPDPATDLTASIYEIVRLKTAWYTIIGPLCLGALLAGAEETTLRALEAFAEDLGVAFQIKDDILSIFASDDVLGKAGASDIAEFKQTLLYAHVRAQGGAVLEELLRYYGKPDLTAEDIAAVRRIFTESGALAYAEAEMNARFDRALGALGQLSQLSDAQKQPLYGLIWYLKLREA